MVRDEEGGRVDSDEERGGVVESNLAHDSFYPLLLSLFFVVVMSGLSMGMSSSSYSAFSHSPLLKVCITGD